MAKSCFSGVRIGGVVTCVPTSEKCIDDEIDLFGGNEKQIARLRKTIGLDRRRVVDPGTTAVDLCEAAARRLLEASEVGVDQVDALIFVTQTPDHLQPCNAAVLHGRLDLAKSCAALDVNLGCSGYVYGLWLAHMMVSAGGCERVLLLAGDTLSRVVNPKDRTVAPLFGDGGSATLIQGDDTAAQAWFSLGTDGKGFDKLIVPAGGQRMPSSVETQVEVADEDGNVRSAENLVMDGAEVFNFSITVEPKAVRELVDYAEVDLEAVDYFVFHQANRYILGNIAKRLKVNKAKVPMQTVERYGNQSSASIPSAMCGELSEVLCGAEAKRVLLSGFGVGLSWGSALVDLSALPVCEIIELNSSQ
ncbi:MULTISPECIES: 3-oxoacyl-[acyl-carrier-protein] synthase III C-terminal domain-containing protein [unclassified Lentimonas]|uniref:3-oxoacyl-[acyl-carrier-protein] synthase III C-terminal domain-containing protein n=1 Tax=unclassified Lentimonas TaxID=2630993 RepID=UPI0013298070|nr:MULTISPECIES: 3-oxoacyl-[acyl-carrier-protein] synthase III C-terminal domain-containing protein [unclassified Lentimonas]CAA6676770.1 3-oxoacyl-[acyl-carrier-protein] synthase, KASIII (EC [Lentimonas sp. CC4]CAA6684565.1 3-oxoacyl-[acyl-carrier-protein] synthase, KASIII (EC [Lentimonas sp. CC6]CAA7075201.1 3-oxoacyl-[acyl-carrier-protein] synthase, KASIII (EC [Lentimonas sp. CC4]CAA7170586.1 3-oxoacyl-[acyl-carrier-protein] synthase, KASIII (EC [Lentimonas sp. CC21]CAA7183206.1 3-oxoacyl-[